MIYAMSTLKIVFLEQMNKPGFITYLLGNKQKLMDNYNVKLN